MKQWIVLLIAIFFVTSAFAASDVQSEKMAEVSAQDEMEAWTLVDMTCADVFDLLTWGHGYLSGRDGLKNTKYTMNKAGINLAVADIVTVCKPDEEKLFLDVVPQIK